MPRTPAARRSHPRSLTLSLAIAAAIATTAASVHARPLVPEDYYRLIGVQTPAISPDGRLVGFVRTAIVEAENRRQSEIWIADANGGSPRRVSDPTLSATAPRWSPDGQLLSFTARR